MFCPKCGTQNPDDGRFCRSCGADLSNVSAALSGKIAPHQPSFYTDRKGRIKSREPHEIVGEGVRESIVAVGFLIAAYFLYYTNIWGGHAWWWALLFPAFIAFSKGISNLVKYKMMVQNPSPSETIQNSPNQTRQLKQPQNQALPPTQTDYVAPPRQSLYDTGEFAELPGSVTESTTRHLEMDSEGETMTLPKK